jgi:hypothetical protein
LAAKNEDERSGLRGGSELEGKALKCQKCKQATGGNTRRSRYSYHYTGEYGCCLIKQSSLPIGRGVYCKGSCLERSLEL